MKSKLKQDKISIFKYLKKHKLALLIYMVITVVATFSGVVTAFYMADLFNNLTILEYEKAIISALIIVGINITVYFLYGLIEIVYSNGIAKPISEEIQKDITNRLIKFKSTVYASSAVGTLSSRVMTEPLRFIDSTDYIFNQVLVVLRSLVIIGYMCFINVWLALAIVVSFIIIAMIRILLLKKENKLENNLKDDREKLQSSLTEIIKSEHDIKALNIDEEIEQISDKNIEKARDSFARFKICQSWIINSFNAFGILYTMGITILAIFLAKEHIIEVALLMYVFANKQVLDTFLYSTFRISNHVRSYKNAKDRVNKLFDDNVYKTEKFGTETIDDFKGTIEFKNVSFKYKDVNLETGEIKDGAQVLNNVNFKIEPNTTVAFVGRSGSGKSTILGLVDKVFEVDSGEIILDGKNINSLDKDTIRNNISMVNQFPYIFDASVKDNLLYVKPDATDEELKDVCKRSDLDEVISELPDGIDTRVGESGVKLSGGQRQRLAIARALLKNSKIILFDESTSSLDNFAQANIQKSIDAIKGGKTIVIVAHRLSTIKSADKIFFVKDGEIKNSGTFDELFETDEEFKKLFLIEVI